MISIGFQIKINNNRIYQFANWKDRDLKLLSSKITENRLSV